MLRRAFPPLLLLALIPTTAQSTRPGSALDWSVAVEGASPEVAVTARWEHAIGSTQLALFVDGQRVQRVSTSLAAGELRFAPAALPPGTVDVELVWSAGRTELGRERLAIDADYAAMLGRLRESSMEPMERMDLDGVMVALVGAFPTSGSTDYERAMAFLEGHGGLFGLVDPRDELVPAERIDGPPVRTLRFTWQHDGIPAPGAGLSVHLAGDRVVGTSGRYPTGWRHTDEARLTENEAVSLALAQSPGSARVGRPRLIWVDGRLHHHEDGEAFLAWEVQIDGAGRGARTVRLDAVTGDVLYDRSAESHAPLNFEIDDADAFIDDGSICFYPITPACSDEDPSCPAGSVTEAFDWMNDAHAYFETRHGFHAWDDEQVELIVDADLSSPAAYKKWPCDQIKFGPGKLEAPGVFFHEWTHGIDEATKALDTNPKTGAVKEHLANMFGMHRVRQDVPDTFDMFAGITSEEGISELGSGVPVDLSGWDDDAEDPHANRNVLDLAARRSWIGANTTGLPIPPMGDEAISRLYWEAFEHQFQPYMLHIDLPYYLLSMALILQQQDDAIGCTGPACMTSDARCGLHNAWASVGFLPPADDCATFEPWWSIGAPNTVDPDQDGVSSLYDLCPEVWEKTQLDTDGDLVGDACDDDDDGDGVPDTSDNCPLVANADQADLDSDGDGDACDSSPDGDNVPDSKDNCPLVANQSQLDTDGDGLGDECDDDDDGDGFADVLDFCPKLAMGFNKDDDGDGIGTNCDNCSFDANPLQTNTDGDPWGDICDDDDDNDGIPDDQDNCPKVPNAPPDPSQPQRDADGDGIGDACDWEDTRRALEQGAFDMDGVWRQAGAPFRLPVQPCEGGVLPGRTPWNPWLDGAMQTRVTVDATHDIGLAIVDERTGDVVARRRNHEATDLGDGTFHNTLVFEPDAQHVWAPPTEGADYTIVLWLPDTLETGERFAMTVGAACDAP